MAGIAAPQRPSADDERQLTRAVIASTIGTSIEWYDFALYGFAAPVIFSKLYFPKSDPVVGLLQSFAIFAIGFLARPIGAAIFGHYGDRIGRKATLVATLSLMGIATTLVAFVPGYAQIGIWGAVILTVLRFVQGIGVGGEWGGSVLLTMEYAKTNARRGLIASWPQFGVPGGMVLVIVVVLLFSALTGKDFYTWGWRIPFALSIVLVGIGLWIRLGILETPTFRRLLAENKIEKAPVREVFRLQGREIVLAALSRMAEQAPFYIYSSFLLTYGTTVLKQGLNFLLLSLLVAGIGSAIWIPVFGHLSDRIGRRKMYLIGSVVTAVFGFVYFAMINTGVAGVIVLAVFLSLIPHGMLYGPQGAFIAEAFTPRLRYSGASLGYQLSSIIAGGPSPLIAAWLLATYHSGYAIAWFLAICGAISFAAALALPDHTNKSIGDEYDQGGVLDVVSSPATA